mgnify:CR=1 FL=1
MNINPVLDQLNSEVAAFPERASGEELYDYVGRVAARFAAAERESLAEAVVTWLKLRSEPKTMLAVQIASDLRLIEVRPDVQSLLNDVHAGRAFIPYYARPIEAALKNI